ncbi:MAG: M56 family metallopeptidase, partial [Terriglobia bacterium]
MVSLHLGLPAFSLFATYFIRILAAYLLCLAVSHLCVRPRARFLVWISFLSGAGVYWMFLLAMHAFGEPGVGHAAIAASHRAFTSSLGFASWSIPSAWSGGIGDAARVLAWGYAAGVALLIFRMLRQRIQLRLVLRRATPSSKELDRIFNDLRRWTGTQYCRVLMLPGLTSPATAYTWRARILLPEFIESYLDNAQLGDVLCHELIHVRRRDYLWGTLAGIIQCVAFFHPAVWLALRHLHRERELACDAAVIRERRGRRPDYAECLTRLTRVRLAAERSLSTINFATSGSFLSLRVRALLVETSRPSWWKRGAALITSVVLLAAFTTFWPALAIMLRFAPPAVTAALHPGAGIRGHRRTLRHHSLRSIKKEAKMSHPPILTTPEAASIAAQSTLSAAVATAHAADDKGFHPVIPESVQKSDSVNHPRTAVSTPPVSGEP